jgi:putative spermidine/putrescine transport system permease protein
MVETVATNRVAAEAPMRRRLAARTREVLVEWGPALPLLVVLALFLVAPIVVLLARSFVTSDGLGLSAWVRVLSQSINQRAIASSLALGFSCAVISVLVGTPLAWLIARMLSGRRAAWLGALNVAAHFGGIGLAFAYVASLGTFGFVTLLFAGIGVPFDPPPRDTLAALVITYEHANIPLYVLLTVPAMGLLRREWSEAAETTGATAVQFWRRIGLPILAPFIGAGFVLAFTWSIGIFGIAYALAGQSAALRVQLITLQIGQSLADDAIRGPEVAAVLSAVLIALAITALVVYRRLLGRGLRWLGTTSMSTSHTEGSLSGRRSGRGRGSRFAKALFFGGFALYLAVPIAAVAVYSFAGRWTSTALPENYSLNNWVTTFTSPTILGAFATSLTLALWTTVLVIGLTVPAVYWARVRNRRIRPLLEISAAIPFALPFVVIGFAVLTFSGIFMPRLQGTFVLLVLASVSVTFPFVYWTVDGAMAAANVHLLTEAAASCGASAWQTLVRVVLPNIRAGVATAAMLSFALAIGEFALVKLLAGAIVTIPVWSAQAMQLRGGSLGPLAVVTSVVFVMLFLISVGIAYLNRGRLAQVGPGIADVAPGAG